jgi:hypothetical protein
VDTEELSEDDVILLEAPPMTLSSLKAQTGCPDPLIGQKGKVFRINIHHLKALEDLCVSSPETMPIQVKKHLGEQMLDMPSLPHAVAMSESENAETQAQVTRALASIAVKESDLTMGGGNGCPVAERKQNHHAQNQG